VRGWVYVLSNPAMPGLVKVGFSMQDPLKRAEELDHTGTPHAYQVDYDVLVENPADAERRLHETLSEYREAKEWFRCSVEFAARAIEEVVGETMIIAERWKEPPTARTGFLCKQCGHKVERWLGQCPKCGAWSALVEDTSPAFPSSAALTAFVCVYCGRKEPHRLAQCPSCRAWNSLVEKPDG
jgi:T5orf172 domain-containing protein/rubredoxin